MRIVRARRLYGAVSQVILDHVQRVPALMSLCGAPMPEVVRADLFRPNARGSLTTRQAITRLMRLPSNCGAWLTKRGTSPRAVARGWPTSDDIGANSRQRVEEAQVVCPPLPTTSTRSTSFLFRYRSGKADVETENFADTPASFG